MRSRKGGGFWNVRSRKCWFPALVRVREWQCSEHASGSKHRCGAWDCIRIISYLCNHSKHLETIYWILLIYIYISITFNRIQSGMIQAYPTIQPKITPQNAEKSDGLLMAPWPHGPISQGAKIEQCLKLQASFGFGDPEVPEVSNPEQCLNFARG